MLRVGKVDEIDSSNGTVRVFFEEDELLSDWLHVIIYNTPLNITIGQMVLCLFEAGPNPAGYVIGGV